MCPLSRDVSPVPGCGRRPGAPGARSLPSLPSAPSPPRSADALEPPRPAGLSAPVRGGGRRRQAGPGAAGPLAVRLRGVAAQAGPGPAACGERPVLGPAPVMPQPCRSRERPDSPAGSGGRGDRDAASWRYGEGPQNKPDPLRSSPLLCRQPAGSGAVMPLVPW
ncbi:uncharacterized protein [Sylvia atricapilla]|uniref:uncharacterized protein n=1 Tax=Sylvia atricapilla TaxID=48155 RepID=UPI0033959CA7